MNNFDNYIETGNGPTMDKQLIAQRFAAARTTYTREAKVQLVVAEKMLQLVRTHLTHAERIVEFGCGTGIYSRLLLQLQPQSLLLNDLCQEMEESVAELRCDPTKTKIDFMAGDAEEFPFPTSCRLITSCSTLQWFNAPAAFFRKCHEALEDNGVLAFSTFGPDNMQEIRHLTGSGLPYLTLDAHKQLLADYELLHTEEERVQLTFTTPQDVLRHMKQTGVTGTEKRVWTRSRLQQFCEAYVREFQTPQGEVTLTYHPIYIVARKRKKQLY